MLGFVLYLVYKPETQSFFTGKPVQEKQGIQKELEQQQVSELDKKVKLCQEQFKWTKQQCLEAYDPKGLQQKNAELEQKIGNNLEVITASYKISDHYDYYYDVAPAPTVHRVFCG
jgi:hypothetical protein